MKKDASRKLLFITIAIVVLTLLSALAINLFTAKKEVTGWLEKVELNYLIGGIVFLGIVLIFLAYLQFIYAKKAEEKPLAERAEPDLKKFHDSLKERYQKRFESKLDERFEITLEVSEDWDGNKTQTFNERYDKDAKISEAFPKIKNLLGTKDGLLIVGEPGAGKTVLLLKVALNLLDKTNFAEKEPIPVIFNLASWSAKEYKDFGTWLKAMLVASNGLSTDFAANLLLEKRLVLLLDGLDELARNEDKAEAEKKRSACLEALNKYLDGEKNVICCRTVEFDEMQKNTAQDAPVSAKVEVLTLTEVEILKALGDAQNHKNTKYHAPAKNLSEIFVKEENAPLRKVLCTPFYFTVALEVFYKRVPEEINLPNDIKKLETYLIEKYVERKLDRTPNPNNFNEEKTKKWLKWLAKIMEKKQLITFELIDLQPDELIRKYLFYLIIFILIFASIYHLNNFIYSSFTGLILGLIAAGTSIALSGKIETEESAKWNFSELLKAKLWVVALLAALGYGVFFGLLFYWLGIGGKYGAFAGTILGLWFAVELVLKQPLSFSHLQHPYQRIRASTFNSMTETGLLFAGIFLIYAIIMVKADSWMIFLLYGFQVLFGLIIGAGIQFYLSPLFKHIVLRFCLYLEGAIPLKYATFLDYAAKTRILEKDGGHWRFRHQNLQVYFAKLND